LLLLPHFQGFLSSLLPFVYQSSEKWKKELWWNKRNTLNFVIGAQHLHLSPRDSGWNRARQPSVLVVHLHSGLGEWREIVPLSELRHADLLFATHRSFFQDQPWKDMGWIEEFGQVVVMCLKSSIPVERCWMGRG
jgi:hypothetical protein